jgi:hypothetical protein
VFQGYIQAIPVPESHRDTGNKAERLYSEDKPTTAPRPNNERKEKPVPWGGELENYHLYHYFDGPKRGMPLARGRPK